MDDRCPRDYIGWIDDLISHAFTWQQDLQQLIFLLDLALRYRYKFDPTKTELFLFEVTFCGKIVDGDGIRFHPSNFDTLQNMPMPRTAQELAQFYHAANWIRSAIPDFATVAQPLLTVLNEIYKKKGNRTKYGMQRYPLIKFGWSEEHEHCFRAIQDAIIAQIKLYHPLPTDTLCLFTDASQVAWGALITSVREWIAALPIESQQHMPVSFFSGAFNPTQLRWNIQDKEAFAIQEVCSKFRHHLLGRKFKLFCDNLNLCYVYEPTRVLPVNQLPRSTLNRLST